MAALTVAKAAHPSLPSTAAPQPTPVPTSAPPQHSDSAASAASDPQNHVLPSSSPADDPPSAAAAAVDAPQTPRKTAASSATTFAATPTSTRRRRGPAAEASEPDYGTFRGWGEERLISLLQDRDIKHAEQSKQIHEQSKQIDALTKTINKLQATLQQAVERMAMPWDSRSAAAVLSSAAPTPALFPTPAPLPTPSASAPAPRGIPGPVAGSSSAIPSTLTAADFPPLPTVDRRALARAALAPVRQKLPRSDGAGRVLSPPSEALTPLWVKIARQPFQQLRAHLRALGIPTSLIHDYAFVRENTLQVIAVKDGRNRLATSFAAEGFTVFETFDPTRPRPGDLPANEHEYARDRFRRQVSNSVEHANARGRPGVAAFYSAWLQRVERDWANTNSATGANPTGTTTSGNDSGTSTGAAAAPAAAEQSAAATADAPASAEAANRL
ncbi:hypothetical protein OC844_006647 [Tilletia horrida]|nr:hypothetical protein OC844_006647 [Tilletia horrida]